MASLADLTSVLWQRLASSYHEMTLLDLTWLSSSLFPPCLFSTQQTQQEMERRSRHTLLLEGQPLRKILCCCFFIGLFKQYFLGTWPKGHFLLSHLSKKASPQTPLNRQVMSSEIKSNQLKSSNANKTTYKRQTMQINTQVMSLTFLENSCTVFSQSKTGRLYAKNKNRSI